MTTLLVLLALIYTAITLALLLWEPRPRSRKRPPHPKDHP